MKQERIELERLANQNGGVLKAVDVVEVAQDEDSPLHKHFEWDDGEAATQYRVQQARALIQRCKITVITQPDRVVRAFVSLPTDREADGGGYRLTVDVLADTDYKEEMMEDLYRTIARWQAKAHLFDKALAEWLEAAPVRTKKRSEEKRA